MSEKLLWYVGVMRINGNDLGWDESRLRCFQFNLL